MDAAHEHRELLAAPACDDRVAGQGGVETGRGDEHVVPGLMPVRVVRALEMVDIEQEQPERLVVCSGDRALE